MEILYFSEQWIVGTRSCAFLLYLCDIITVFILACSQPGQGTDIVLKLQVLHVSVRNQWLPSYHCWSYKGEHLALYIFSWCCLLNSRVSDVTIDLGVLSMQGDVFDLDRNWLLLCALIISRQHFQYLRNMGVQCWFTRRLQIPLQRAPVCYLGSQTATLDCTPDIWPLGQSLGTSTSSFAVLLPLLL